VIARTLPTPGGSEVLLLAPVRGLSSEVAPLRAALESFHPESLGVGISPEELGGFQDYFVGVATEPLVPLTSTEVSEVRALTRFGEVSVPNPAVLAALEWGQGHGVPVAALDPDEEESASLFTEHIGYLELVRRTVRERRLGREPPRPSSADAFALAWDRSANPGRGSERFAEARDGIFASAVLRLAEGRHRVAAIADRERFGRIAARLGAPEPRGPAAD
jgi:hypothetical protein